MTSINALLISEYRSFTANNKLITGPKYGIKHLQCYHCV